MAARASHDSGARDPRGLAHFLAACARLFALQDLILIAYLFAVSVLVWRAPPSDVKTWCARGLYACICAIVLACFAGRGLSQMSSTARSGIYRGVLVGVLLTNYLMLRVLLPLVRSDAVDGALLRVDLGLFGVEPALWLERFNRPGVVEWFSFFYFSYFWLGMIYMLALVWICRLGPHTAEFAIGTLLVFCVGQLGYTAVPGYGPARYLASSFHGPLIGGLFWWCVSRTVAVGGAMKDIFPSLHTAAPIWFTLYAFRRARRDARWRLPAGVTAFMAANIVVSTMLLRWHYAIDVIAGLLLASATALIAPRLAAWEDRFRRSLGYDAVWSFRVEVRRSA